MKSKVTATATDGILEDIIIQGDTDSLCAIWTAVSYAVGGRLSRERNMTLSVALDYMGKWLKNEANEVDE